MVKSKKYILNDNEDLIFELLSGLKIQYYSKLEIITIKHNSTLY